MAVIYVTPANSFITITGSGKIIAGGDTINVIAEAYLGTIDPFGSGITLSGSINSITGLYVNGDVSGDGAGIYMSTSVSFETDLNIGSAGSVYSGTAAAIAINRSPKGPVAYIVNDGEIHTGGATAISLSNAGIHLTNNASISSYCCGNAIYAESSIVTAVIRNNGTIAGNIFVAASANASVYNDGIINGFISLGSATSGFALPDQHGTAHGDVLVSEPIGTALQANLSHGTVFSSTGLKAGGSSYVNFTEATFIGNVLAVGTFGWIFGFADAKFQGGLSLPSADLT